ncbi:hypothetical protein EU545_05375 [Candidatus Thorarchaeota archaeon]|jgi:hypothetical protein|nr:MAG: hypothetical protein EU545_05375 [Candidatus Thorarchaeota archaeon]
MKLNFREFFIQKMQILFKPEDIEMSAKDFLSAYASYMEDVGIVGKGPDGYSIYPSKTAPIREEHVDFFEEWVRLNDALDIHAAVGMDLYTDGWFAKDPKYQTMNDKGVKMEHQICPNRPEFWEYGAEIVKEIGAYPVDEILLFGTGFIRDQFCFCDRCRADFAPLVDQEPERLTYQFLTENPEHHEKWHEWRSDIVHEGLKTLQQAATESDEESGREDPLRLSVEVLLDPETGLSEGAKNEYGYDYTRIGEITKSILINLFPWSPIIPQKGSDEYSELVESLYYVNEFTRKGGRASLFRWGVTDLDHVQELKALGRDVGIDRIVTSFHYPSDYSRRRESAIGNY